jgi:hypothetical protein
MMRGTHWSALSGALLWLALWHSIVRGVASAADTCPAGKGKCDAEDVNSAVNKTKAFWKEMKQRGLEVKLKKTTVLQKANGNMPARNRTGMVLSTDVFYGRAIIKFPQDALISAENCQDKALRRELRAILEEKKTLAKKYNVSGEEAEHLLSLAYPLIAENRNPESVFRAWLTAVQDERVTALQFTERQRSALKGTTVEGAYLEMVKNRDLIFHSAGNFSYFKKWPVTMEEAAWALAVIMRHARVVHPHQDVREKRHARMYLIPIVQLLGIALHPEPALAISFQSEITVHEKREEEMVLQIARRDMAKGEEIFLWPGRLSNSEVAVRPGLTFASNPVGIGRNTTQPTNWHDNPETRIRKEYEKFNCSSLEGFEMRFSPRGLPMPIFRRCFRVSWFLTHGWYNPGLVNKIRDLNKWPPPKQYKHEDWLAWTQADQALNDHILEYCQHMRQQLKETIDAKTAEEFRSSKDDMDRLLWHVRSEESKTFKECIKLANEVKVN